MQKIFFGLIMINNNLKICKCGYKINDPHIVAKTNYSSWGWFLFTILGMSAKPISIDFICTVCGDKLESSTDQETLKRFIGR